MSDMPVVVSRVQQARELFFAEGRSPDGWVPPHITRSWMRCRSNGHRPDLYRPSGDSPSRSVIDPIKHAWNCVTNLAVRRIMELPR